MHSLQQFALEHLVTRGDVVDGNAGEHVARDGKDAVQDKSPIALYPVRTRVEAVAEDRVGVTFENGLDQCGVIAGIVFKVRVLDEHQLARLLRPYPCSSRAKPA